MTQEKFGINRFISLVILLVIVLFLSGCGHSLTPQAKEFLRQAQGETGVNTALTLIGVMGSSLEQAKSETGESAGLTMLHDQFHALRHSLCDATEAQTKTASYDESVTILKEMKTVFHRLWDYRDDATRRSLHLDLFGNRLKELRQALQAI